MEEAEKTNRKQNFFFFAKIWINLKADSSPDLDPSLANTLILALWYPEHNTTIQAHQTSDLQSYDIISGCCLKLLCSWPLICSNLLHSNRKPVSPFGNSAKAMFFSAITLTFWSLTLLVLNYFWTPQKKKACLFIHSIRTPTARHSIILQPRAFLKNTEPSAVLQNEAPTWDMFK